MIIGIVMIIRSLFYCIGRCGIRYRLGLLFFILCLLYILIINLKLDEGNNK